jgi:hypothetical protein
MESIDIIEGFDELMKNKKSKAIILFDGEQGFGLSMINCTLSEAMGLNQYAHLFLRTEIISEMSAMKKMRKKEDEEA